MNPDLFQLVQIFDQLIHVPYPHSFCLGQFDLSWLDLLLQCFLQFSQILQIASDANLSETRLVVGASIGIAGIASYLIRPPGGPVRANINANEALRRQWQREVDQVVEENDRRRADVQIRIRARDPVIIESRR